MENELVWIWLPALAVAGLAVWLRRRQTNASRIPRHEARDSPFITG
jgi:uncharacterized iron-regulated membrane protein